MSKDIVVLTPNARRIIVHCTPDTSILQVIALIFITNQLQVKQQKCINRCRIGAQDLKKQLCIYIHVADNTGVILKNLQYDACMARFSLEQTGQRLPIGCKICQQAFYSLPLKPCVCQWFCECMIACQINIVGMTYNICDLYCLIDILKFSCT